jgi:hypothetical protein
MGKHYSLFMETFFILLKLGVMGVNLGKIGNIANLFVGPEPLPG